MRIALHSTLRPGAAAAYLREHAKVPDELRALFDRAGIRDWTIWRSGDRLFASDHDDGSLDLLTMGALPLELTVAAKAIAHWLTTALPLIVITPVLGLMLNVDMNAMGYVALTLLAGTPALTFIGLIGAALSVTLRRGGLLMAILVLPLTVPVLIFGVAAANAAIVGPAPFGPPFTILCALSLASFVLGPFAAAAALRQGQE